MASGEPLPAGLEWPPTEDELPCDDGIPLETQCHVLQFYLLMDPLLLHWADRQDVFVGGNIFVYFSLEQVRHQDFRGPDFFVVLDVPRRERKSWVVWQEGKGKDGEWAGFALREGVYVALDPEAQERLVSQRLGLALVRWDGTYQGISARWLRWATREGALLPTAQEPAERERQQAEAVRQRAVELEMLLARYRQRFGDLAQ